jgi:hypothetical protein
MRRGSYRQRCCLMSVFLAIVQDYFVVISDALCLPLYPEDGSMLITTYPIIRRQISKELLRNWNFSKTHSINVHYFHTLLL